MFLKYRSRKTSRKISKTPKHNEVQVGGMLEIFIVVNFVNGLAGLDRKLSHSPRIWK